METFGLALSFFITTFLLLSLNLRANWHWSIKIVAIVLTAFLWFIFYFSTNSLLGTPVAAQKLPDEFEIIWSYENENTKKIYIWVIEQKKPQILRVYQLPYSSEMHQQLFEAKKKICKGKPQKGKVTKGRNVGKEKNEQRKNKFEFLIEDKPTHHQILPPKRGTTDTFE